ncbi:MAG: methyltransferase domain-containing protein, partial [Phototrophicaceae bacterium]
YVDEFFLRAVKSINADQPILDLGGHKLNKRGVFNIDDYNLPVYYANLTADKGADFLSDAAHIAVADNSFGTVICAELLEHVPQPIDVLRDVHRVLQPNGKLLITVPFLYQIHADPYDFGRYTDYYWRNNLQQLGFKDIQIEKQGLFWSVLIDMIRLMIYKRENHKTFVFRILEYLIRHAKHFARRKDMLIKTRDESFMTSFTSGFAIVCHKSTNDEDIL